MGRTAELLIQAEVARRDVRRAKRVSSREAALLAPTFRLRHVGGSLAGKEQVFDLPSVLVGRGDGNDVALDPFRDATVSANHAEIRWERGEFVVYDMGSLNGTWVNGIQVRRCLLRDGDEVSLGRRGAKFLFRSDMKTPDWAETQDGGILLDRSENQASLMRMIVTLIVLAAVDATLHVLRYLR